MWLAVNMSNCIFIFSICLITTIVGYTTWVNVTSFLDYELIKKSEEKDMFHQYYAYLSKYNKTYNLDEFLIRIEYFKKSLKEISRLNSIQSGNVYGLTKFSDMSEIEFSDKMLSPIVNECRRLRRDKCPLFKKKRHHQGNHKKSKGLIKNRKNESLFSKNFNDDIPLKVDWRKRGVVTEVLNQKYCRACWAMSIVGVMETMAAIDSGILHHLSAQELLDCSDHNYQCSGGDIREALNFLCSYDFPIVHERNYPLILVNQTCRIPLQNSVRGMRIKNFVNECDMDEDTMLRVIAKHGPVVVAVNARNWYYYTGGIIQQACANEWIYMQHVVQIVGYDLTSDPPYYIARNSWGPDFGENGYVRLATHRNICGVANNVAYFDVDYK